MSEQAVVARPLAIDDFITVMVKRPNGERWFLDDGRPVMNPQPTLRHDWIQTNILVALRTRWDRDRSTWRPFGPSQVPVPDKNRTVAPDVIVAPIPERYDVSVTHRPIVAFEVLSKSDTKARRLRKLADYEAIDSIRHYIVVRQDRQDVVAYQRGADSRFASLDVGNTVDLTAIGVSLTFDEIYDAAPLTP